MMGFQVSHGYLSVILILVGQYILTAEAIKCYKCIFAEYVYVFNNTHLCKDFDYSEKFITDCPFSTVCMKKNSYTVINGVQINGTERDCASQRLDTQELSQGKWSSKTLVEEPYAEGCKIDDNKLYKMPYVEHCYCRGELCNTGNTVYGGNGAYFYRTLILSAFSTFIINKAVQTVFL